VTPFGEELPLDVLLRARQSAQLCDLFLVVGSTSIVYPAAELPVIALRNGANMIVLDAEPPFLAHAADVALHGNAEDQCHCVTSI
jgi:NAD-dependent deacetylase